MEIKTWAEFGALTDEERSAYTPEEMETLKTSIIENEKERDEKLVAADKYHKDYESQKIRAEKAESKLKELGGEIEKSKSQLSPEEILSLAKSDTHPEDLEEIVNYAKFKGISVLEDRKDKTIHTNFSVQFK